MTFVVVVFVFGRVRVFLGWTKGDYIFEFIVKELELGIELGYFSIFYVGDSFILKSDILSLEYAFLRMKTMCMTFDYQVIVYCQIIGEIFGL